MSIPQNFQDFPEPAASFQGAQQRGSNLGDIADRYRPDGTTLEPKGSTLARYANRLLDRQTGKAYSVDELANGDRVAVAADDLVIPPTARYVAKTTGADAEALTLADGTFPGQRVNVRLVTDGGGAGTLTPASPIGFATVVFADAGDFAEFEWTVNNDGTAGWILMGVGGLTAQPTVTA